MTLQVGDKVKVVAAVGPAGDLFIGQVMGKVGTLIEDAHDVQPYKVMFEEPQVTLWFYPGEIEKVTEEAAQ